MTIKYEIARSGSLAGIPHFIALGHTEGIEAKTVAGEVRGLSEPNRPLRVMISPDDSTEGNYDWYLELVGRFREGGPCQLMLSTIDRPNRVFDLFDYVRLHTDAQVYTGYPANEVWLDTRLTDTLDFSVKFLGKTDVWINLLPGKQMITAADRFDWATKQPVPVRFLL